MTGQLNVYVTKSGRITITLPVSALKMATKHHPKLEHYDADRDRFSLPRVTNGKLFAGEVLRALNREEEDGTTLVHHMFDKAILEAIEQGAEGVEFPSERKPRNRKPRT